MRGRDAGTVGVGRLVAAACARACARACAAVWVAVWVAACASPPRAGPREEATGRASARAERVLREFPAVSDFGRDLTTDQQVLQVLDRAAFGPRPGDVARVRRLGVDRWIAEQLTPDGIDDGAMDAFVARIPPDTAQSNGAADPRVVKVARAVASERQLQEVMVDFWENHFTVYAGKGRPMRDFLPAYDRDVIRPHALGHFRDLLGAVAKSPAMLFYLDNWRSGVRGLNENYGRELLELHTLGVDGGYTQADVIAVARALTGWSIDRPAQGGGFIFRPRLHDTGEKVLLGHHLAAGRGIADAEEVLDILARHPSTARFVALKLCERFVSDTPPPALVARTAATFTRTDGDLRQVVWTILTSPEFFSRAAYRAKVKSPFELVVSAVRALGGQPDSTRRSAQVIARLGEPVFGHQAPNGYPETGTSWMSTGAILARINFGQAAAAGRIPGASLDDWPAARILRTAPRAAQVDSVVGEILGGAASPDSRAILLSGGNPLDTGGGTPLRGLAQIVGLALGAPEFQRR